MYTFPLEEIEPEEIEKEKKEKASIKRDDSSHTQESESPYIQPVWLILGIIISLIALVDMIVLFVIPYKRIQTNKRKLPDATFHNPSKTIIAFHFILHSLVILIGILFILFSLREYKQIDHICTLISLIMISSITAIIYFLALGFGFSYTSSIYTKMTAKKLISILSRNPPINYAFIYSKCEEEYVLCSPTCTIFEETLYSKNGIIFPVNTTITSPIYNFDNTPEMYYFVIEQKVNMSFELITYFDKIITQANSCDKETTQEVVFYPVIRGDYYVAKEKMPTYLSKGTRIASILFGVGVYYELNFKSIPYITYIQHSDASIVQGIDYNQIFTSDNCKNYGKCTHSSKPKP